MVVGLGLDPTLTRDIHSRVLVLEVDSGLVKPFEKRVRVGDDDRREWPEMYGKILFEGLIR